MRFLFTVFLLLCLSATSFAAPTIYSQTLEDLPLMQGMAEQTDSAVIFDAPEGRIIDFDAKTTATQNDILSFYAQTLPALGWEKAAPDTFVRDAEKLTLRFDQKNTVHFTLSPKG